MNQPIVKRLWIAAALCVLAGMVVAGTMWVLAIRAGDTTPTTLQTTTSHNSTGASTQPSTNKPSASATNSNSSQTTPATNSAGVNTSDHNIKACSIVPVSVAQRIIGTDAKAAAAPDTTAYNAPDTAVTACAYSSGTGTLQVIIRAPQNALGVSKNALLFGSGRPAGVVTLTGYGQAAYWNPANKQLDVLKDNSWYIITTGSGTQADAETAAKQVFAV